MLHKVVRIRQFHKAAIHSTMPSTALELVSPTRGSIGCGKTSGRPGVRKEVVAINLGLVPARNKV